MKLSQVQLKGFRNFKEATVNFNEKSLIIGANDVGKTNLIWALRLVLDRSLSELDLEPKDSDFFAYEETNKLEIIIKFENVIEDCVVSKLKGKISDKDELYLAYKAFREKDSGAKSYYIYAGHALDSMEEIEERYYRKVLHLRYISSKRDFRQYINKEKKNLFQIAKKNRSSEQIEADDKLYTQIKTCLEVVDSMVPKLNYINSATKSINEELEKLSVHHRKQNITFDANSSDTDTFINDVKITSKSGDKSLVIGGDGRLNQIYLSLWAAKNEISEENIREVTLICVEEPEAHLHPHQQRKLAEYLNLTINGQVFITSHSPQIACEFNPNSIIRLLERDLSTVAASNGCSKIIDDAFNDFGYRLSIIPAEAFFADVVLLVEGPSEELFYKTLAKQLNIDLDRLNISVLSVAGVGFDTYINILNSLGIKWVLRTDNDISKIPYKEEYSFVGIVRGMSIWKKTFGPDKNIEETLKALRFTTNPPLPENIATANSIKEWLEPWGIYIGVNDLENDLFYSEIKEIIKSYFPELDDQSIVIRMQDRKAKFMYSFLKDQKASLGFLRNNQIAKPLFFCKNLIEAQTNGTNPSATINN